MEKKKTNSPTERGTKGNMKSLQRKNTDGIQKKLLNLNHDMRRQIKQH